MKLVISNLPKLFRADALSAAPYIFIVERFKDNKALIEHEMVHIREQEESGLLVWWFKYVFSRSFRLNAEVRAYKVQIAYGLPIDVAATYLSEIYFLGISFEEAKAALS